MFTGIIEEIGTIKGVKRGDRSVVLEVEAQKILEDVKIGDSIATNGVCLTVAAIKGDRFFADVMPETVTRSNLGCLRAGDRVNLERALCLNGRLGGHIVSGHIDGTGKIVNREKDENAIWITIDGISLTVAGVSEDRFQVSIIPHTRDETTLVKKAIGEVVNLENDIVAKYIEKLLKPTSPSDERKPGLTLDFLLANGF